MKPIGCESQPGSPTDLASEPAGWLAFGRYLRWTDRDGCLVRVDVISHIRGVEHCEFQSAEFITIGSQIGDSISDGQGRSLNTNNNRYVWDPEGVLDRGPYDTTVDVADSVRNSCVLPSVENQAELYPTLGPHQNKMTVLLLGFVLIPRRSPGLLARSVGR